MMQVSSDRNTGEINHNSSHLDNLISFYKFVQVHLGRNTLTEEKLTLVSNNWNTLKEQNIMKANFICNDIFDYPESKDDINQQLIFNCQKEKFVDKDDSVSILSSFPLFLYEYFK